MAGPIDAVNIPKQKHIIRAAKQYLYKNKIKNVNIRFDVIEIYIQNNDIKIKHIKQIL